MKLLLIHGSPRRSEDGNTVNISTEFIKHLKLIIADLEISIYFLAEKNILSCKGCFNCLRKEIENCP